MTDSTIARHPEKPIEGLETTWWESHYNSPYVLSRAPDYILFSTGFKPSAPAERALFLHRAFLEQYRTVGFFFSGSFHPVFKRYFPVDSEIRRDIDVRFVQNLNAGINLLLQDRAYQESRKAFDRARQYLGDIAYPYLHYYTAISYGRQQLFDSSRIFLEKAVDCDSLIYEAILGLSTLAYADRDFEKFAAYRDRLAALVPWYLPRMDSMMTLGN